MLGYLFLLFTQLELGVFYACLMLRLIPSLI